MMAIINTLNNKTMNKYQYTDKCAEIFGHDCEKVCREMTIAGTEWLDKHPNANINVANFNGLLWPILPRTDDLQELENVMNAAACGHCSIFMIQLSIGYAYCAKSIGWDAYIRNLEELGEEERKEREQQKQAL
jgi:hypothetical protein